MPAQNHARGDLSVASPSPEISHLNPSARVGVCVCVCDCVRARARVFYCRMLTAEAG